MADDSMEVLARSQLEMLYELGILERSSDDEEPSRSSKNDRSGRHDAFLAALPPPSVIFPIHSRMFQSLVDDSDASQRSDSEFNGENNSGVPSNLLEISRQRQQYKPRLRTSLRSSNSSASSSSLKSIKQDRRALRMWFRQWKSFIRCRREKARRQAAADAFLKQNIMTKWATFLKHRRYEHEKKQLVDSWKVSRAISRWTLWKHRCCTLRGLLSMGRSSFMGRLIQQRVWRRWIQFSKRRKYINGVLAQRTGYLHRRIMRSAWTELRIHAFRARQESLVLRRCMKAMRNLCAIQERQRLMCLQYQLKMNIGRKRELLQRWRAFAYASSRDKRLSWRVQFDVRRRKYFLLWCEVARTVNHVERLRSKLMNRELWQHFSAWKATARAIQIGEQVRKTGEKRIRGEYFRAFKDQAVFNAHCKRVNLTLNHRRLAATVHYLHVWTLKRRRLREEINRMRKIWQMRLLRRVWLACWLTVHHTRLANKHSCSVLRARYFDARKRFHRLQQTCHLQEERAETLHCKFCCKRAFKGWKLYYKLRLEHAQRLVKAQEHYRLHLLQRGVVVLWGSVYQNAQSSLRAHQLRQNMRLCLKKRHFRAWHSLTQSRKGILERLHHLQKSPGYRKSTFNPSRRAWDRWATFVGVGRQRLRCERHFLVRRKRQVLLEWHRHVKVESRLRCFDFHRRRRAIEALFSLWKVRVEKWKKVGTINELAERVYERKLCTRVIRNWRFSSSYFRRVRRCGETISHQREMKLQMLYFLECREKFAIRQCVSRLRRSRERQLLQICFTSWFKHSAQLKAFTRKLIHFRKVYGKYSVSSIVSRVWCRWQRTCKQSRYIKVLHRKIQLRQARRCWSHWKDFHNACCIFRIWRQVALAISKSNNRLGMRLRCFRESRLHRLQRSTMDEWKCLVASRRNLQEKQSFWKHKLHRELEESTLKVEKAARIHLSSWFRRLYIAHIKDSILAREHYRYRLLSKVILSWWKSAIHSKQEKVLVDAQQAMGKLSYYHPQQQVYATQARISDNQKKEKKRRLIRKEKAKVMAIKTPNARVESMRRMRRMLDPTEYASYSRFYQENGREIMRKEPYNEAIRTPRAKAVFDHPMEPRRRMHSDQSPRVDRTVGGFPANREPNKLDHGEDEACCDISKTRNRKVQQRGASVLSASSNQASFDPQIPVHPVTEFIEILHRDDFPASPVASNKSHPNISKGPENVLPLFDDEISGTGAGKSNTQTDRVATAKPQVRFAPETQSEQRVNTTFGDPDVNGSFIPSVESGHDDDPRDPHALNADSRRYESGVRAVSNATPSMLDPSLRLAPVSESENVDRRLKPQLGKTRKASHKKKLKVVNSSNNEARPLADILRLSDGVEANRPGSEVHAGTHWGNDNVWDASMLKEVVAFYVDSVTTHANDKDELKPTRFCVCFRMARDLALLQNDFYIDELLKVYDTSFKGKFISGMDDEQMNFELFLEQLVESHPTYRKYVDLRLRQHYTAPLSALDWLTQNHLRPHIVQRKRARARTIKSKTFWIWESMPTDMDLALEKLLPAIKKYMRVLGQFFLRQAVQSSSTTDKPRDYRMSSNAFISLMKQVRVFPQLFHRRELENAVRLSCCSSPETEKLNFPEFIETLVRCSCTLRWGELDGGKTASENNDDTVVVIKFVMLIFAMEGQGSVLKKRSEDVSAILGFLGQQQKKKQAEKLFRFRKMLADNKRRTRASRTHQIPSVWNQVRLHFSPTNPPSRSPTRSHDTFDELTESWDGGSPRRVSSEPFVFDAQTNQPFDIDSPHSPNADAMNHQQQSQPDSVKFVENNYDQKGITSCSVDKASFSPPFSSEAPSTTLEAGIPGDHDSTVTDSTQRKESTVSKECSASSIICQEEKESIASVEGLNDATSTAGDEEAMSSEQVHQFTTPSQSIGGLVEPMEKDNFLREILDSIGDVELMLSQPRFTGSNYSKLARKQVRRTLQDSTQDAVHADSIGCVPSLSELAGDTCSHLHDWKQISDIFSTSSEASEVQVRDPILNHLTDIERFTKSSDDTSLVAIAGMAGLLFTQDPAIQNHLPESNAGASQEIRPAEEIATSSQVSTHEIDKDTIK